MFNTDFVFLEKIHSAGIIKRVLVTSKVRTCAIPDFWNQSVVTHAPLPWECVLLIQRGMDQPRKSSALTREATQSCCPDSLRSCVPNACAWRCYLFESLSAFLPDFLKRTRGNAAKKEPLSWKAVGETERSLQRDANTKSIFLCACALPFAGVLRRWGFVQSDPWTTW